MYSYHKFVANYPQPAPLRVYGSVKLSKSDETYPWQTLMPTLDNTYEVIKHKGNHWSFSDLSLRHYLGVWFAGHKLKQGAFLKDPSIDNHLFQYMAAYTVESESQKESFIFYQRWSRASDDTLHPLLRLPAFKDTNETWAIKVSELVKRVPAAFWEVKL